ncbi:MAG: hypothetical protein NDI61_04695 [Bdellovibrionaceae bacterium]|nr:hypothetical protein [Pseudobdellovibrionaceae bacterium]
MTKLMKSWIGIVAVLGLIWSLLSLSKMSTPVEAPPELPKGVQEATRPAVERGTERPLTSSESASGSPGSVSSAAISDAKSESTEQATQVPAEQGVAAFRRRTISPSEVQDFLGDQAQTGDARDELLAAAERGELRRVLPLAGEVEVRAATVTASECSEWNETDLALLVRVDMQGRPRAAAVAKDDGTYQDAPSWVLSCRFQSSDRRVKINGRGFLFLKSGRR